MRKLPKVKTIRRKYGYPRTLFFAYESNCIEGYTDDKHSHEDDLSVYNHYFDQEGNLVVEVESLWKR